MLQSCYPSKLESSASPAAPLTGHLDLCLPCLPGRLWPQRLGTDSFTGSMTCTRCSMNFLTAWDLGEALKYSLLGVSNVGRRRGACWLRTHTPWTLTTSGSDRCFLNSRDLLQHPGTNVLSEDSMTIQHEHREILSCRIHASMLWVVSSVFTHPPHPQPHSPSGCPGPLVQKPWIYQDRWQEALQKLWNAAFLPLGSCPCPREASQRPSIRGRGSMRICDPLGKDHTTQPPPCWGWWAEWRDWFIPLF